MKSLMFATTLWRDGPDGEEIEVAIIGHFTPGVRGRLGGLPENCYPDEPSVLEVEQDVTDEEQKSLHGEAIQQFGEYGEKWEDEQRAEAALMRREDY